MSKTINSEQAAECLYALFAANPWMLEMKPDPTMLHHEAAAQQSLIDWCEGRQADLLSIPRPVACLAIAFVTQMLSRLATQDRMYAGVKWSIPDGLSLEASAKVIIAHEIGLAIRRAKPIH